MRNIKGNTILIALVCAWLFYLYEYLLRVAPSSMTSELILSFGVNSTQLGWLFSAYYLTYVILQIPCGLIVDVWGVRKIIVLSSFVCCFGSIIFAWGGSIWAAQIGRLFIGAGSACAFVSCGKIANEYKNGQHFDLIMGITMVMGLTGATMGSWFCSHLMVHYSWQSVAASLGFLGTGIAAMAWVGIPKSNTTSSPKEPYNLGQEIKAVFCEKSILWIGFYGLCMYLPLSAFAELWGVSFLSGKYNITKEVASKVAVIFFWGSGLGCVLAPILARFFKSYKGIILTAPVLALALFIGIFFAPNLSWPTVNVLFFLTGVLSGTHILCFALIKSNVSQTAAGTAVGLMNFFIMSSGLIGSTLIGCLLDYFWDGQLSVDGRHMYSPQNFTVSCSSIVILFLVGACLTAPFINTKTNSQKG